MLTEPIERYVCARVSRDGKDDGTVSITDLANGEVKIDVNGDVYVCSAIPACQPLAEDEDDTLSGNETVTGNDTQFGTPTDTLQGNDSVLGNDTIQGEVCEEVTVSLNYDETVATIRGLLNDITFVSESDFKAEVNTDQIYRLPKKGTIVDASRISALVPNKNNAWLQFAGIANSIPFTLWRIPRNRKNKDGQSNIEYYITLFHEEGVIQVRIRAVET